MADGEKRILVVDDDDAIRALLLTILRRRGYKVDIARNGSEAVERCLRCRYAVVLLDLMMPTMSGYDVLDHLAQLTQRPLVIVLTAGMVTKPLDPNLVSGTLRKPFDIQLLADTVRGCLTRADEIAQDKRCPPADSEESEQL